jgi:hypothetical protein
MIYPRYAVVAPAGNFAGGRVEPNILFYENFARCAKIFVKKIKKYHATAGEDGFHGSPCLI